MLSGCGRLAEVMRTLKCRPARFLIVKILVMCKTSLYAVISRGTLEREEPLLGDHDVEGLSEFGHNN